MYNNKVILPFDNLKLNGITTINKLGVNKHYTNVLPPRTIIPIYLDDLTDDDTKILSEIINGNYSNVKRSSKIPSGWLLCDGMTYKVNLKIKNNYITDGENEFEINKYDADAIIPDDIDDNTLHNYMDENGIKYYYIKTPDLFNKFPLFITSPNDNYTNATNSYKLTVNDINDDNHDHPIKGYISDIIVDTKNDNIINSYYQISTGASSKTITFKSKSYSQESINNIPESIKIFYFIKI
jgi:hypothetical protein